MAAVKEYDLTIAEHTVNITGKPVERITVNGKFVAPVSASAKITQSVDKNSVVYQKVCWKKADWILIK